VVEGSSHDLRPLLVLEAQVTLVLNEGVQVLAQVPDLASSLGQGATLVLALHGDVEVEGTVGEAALDLEDLTVDALGDGRQDVKNGPLKLRRTLLEVAVEVSGVLFLLANWDGLQALQLFQGRLQFAHRDQVESLSDDLKLL